MHGESVDPGVVQVTALRESLDQTLARLASWYPLADERVARGAARVRRLGIDQLSGLKINVRDFLHRPVVRHLEVRVGLEFFDEPHADQVDRGRAGDEPRQAVRVGLSGQLTGTERNSS